MLHGGIDRALESVKAGELGPVQYQKWLQAIVVLHDVLLAYRAWEDEHHGFWYQGYVYDHLRLDETRHKAGFKTKLEWPLDLEACE